MDSRVFSVWQPSYSVGHSVLDAQHKKLLKLCGEAVECMDQPGRDGAEHFHLILNDLASYVNEHFRTEEAILRDCNYPLLTEHQAEHTLYQITLTDFLMSATLGHIDQEGLSEYLAKWWSDHILTADKQYSSYIRGLH